MRLMATEQPRMCMDGDTRRIMKYILKQQVLYLLCCSVTRNTAHRRNTTC